MTEQWIELEFKDVPERADFGYKDYFFYKTGPFSAIGDMSGEEYTFYPDTKVVMEISQ